MKWKRTRSEHVDDLRGQSPGRTGLGTLGKGGIALGGAGGILFVLLSMFLGGGGGGLGGMLGELSGSVPQAPAGQGGPPGTPPPTEESEFVTFLTEDIQAMWADEFARSGRQYSYARVNMFTDQVNTACGPASSAVGPFYCPADSEVYVDLGFFDELQTRFGAQGDFAQAYVIAHEFGHHIQNVLGISEEVRRQERSAGSQADANRWTVRLELQADCLAGVWAHSVYARGDLDSGDVEEGLAAAQAVGDDRIQEQAGMRVNPETWTHGSSQQRQEWFYKGYTSGKADDCDTFA